MDVCFTGNENVKPSSLCLPGGGCNSSGSELTNFASLDAIKSNNSCNPIINIFNRVVRLITLIDFVKKDLLVKNQSSNEEEWKLLQTLFWQHLSPSHLNALEGFGSLCHQGLMHKRVLSHPYKQWNKVKNEPRKEETFQNYKFIWQKYLSTCFSSMKKHRKIQTPSFNILLSDYPECTIKNPKPYVRLNCYHLLEHQQLYAFITTTDQQRNVGRHRKKKSHIAIQSGIITSI